MENRERYTDGNGERVEGCAPLAAVVRPFAKRSEKKKKKKKKHRRPSARPLDRVGPQQQYFNSVSIRSRGGRGGRRGGRGGVGGRTGRDDAPHRGRSLLSSAAAASQPFI